MTQDQPLFTRLARAVAHAAGRPTTFILAVAIIAGWGFSGPLFGFSDTWQLVINTGTTIITFLMVFLIQNTQNRDSLAIQLKLDELILAMREASNTYVDLEDDDDRDLEKKRRMMKELAEKARDKGSE